MTELIRTHPSPYYLTETPPRSVCPGAGGKYPRSPHATGGHVGTKRLYHHSNRGIPEGLLFYTGHPTCQPLLPHRSPGKGGHTNVPAPLSWW